MQAAGRLIVPAGGMGLCHMYLMSQGSTTWLCVDTVASPAYAYACRTVLLPFGGTTTKAAAALVVMPRRGWSTTCPNRCPNSWSAAPPFVPLLHFVTGVVLAGYGAW